MTSVEIKLHYIVLVCLTRHNPGIVCLELSAGALSGSRVVTDGRTESAIITGVPQGL